MKTIKLTDEQARGLLDYCHSDIIEKNLHKSMKYFKKRIEEVDDILDHNYYTKRADNVDIDMGSTRMQFYCHSTKDSFKIMYRLPGGSFCFRIGYSMNTAEDQKVMVYSNRNLSKEDEEVLKSLMPESIYNYLE